MCQTTIIAFLLTPDAAAHRISLSARSNVVQQAASALSVRAPGLYPVYLRGSVLSELLDIFTFSPKI